MMETFITYISRSDVQALRYNLICNGFDPESDEWVAKPSHESDCHVRPKLKSLIKTIGERGAILLPTIGDLTGYQSKPTFDLIDQITAKLIPVLTIVHDRFPLAQISTGPSANAEIFGAMAFNAIGNENYFRKFMENRAVMERHL